MSKMSVEFRDAHSEVEWLRVIGMRNLLAHAYHRIESELVWTAASEDMPALLNAMGLPSAP